MPEETGPSATYYLRHFEIVVAHSVERYGDLLYPEETGVIEAFNALDRPARQLYARLFNRRHRWFLLENIEYAEIGPLGPPLDALICSGLARMERPGPDHWDEIFPVLTRAHLAAALKQERPKGTKNALGQRALARLETDPEALLPMIRLLHTETFELLMLLYFGNPWQDLSSLVLEELETTRHLPTPLSAHRLFQNREHLNAYLAARKVERRLHDLLEAGEIDAVLEEVMDITAFFEKGTAMGGYESFGKNARHIFARILTWFSGELRQVPDTEVMEFLTRAVALPLPADLLIPIQERLALHLRRSGHRTRLIGLLRSLRATDTPLTFRQEAIVARSLRYLSGRRKAAPAPEEITVELTPWTGTRGGRRLYTSEDGPVAVEEAVINHFRGRGFDGWHVENAFIPTFAAVTFVEAFSADVPGVFQSRYQSAPLDFYSMDFFERRAPLIDQLARDILSAPDPRALLTARYGELQGMALAGADWRRISPALFARALSALPLQGLVSVARHYLRHPKEHGTGMPDLLLLHQDNGEALWAEVKSPSDTLSDLQLHWLEHLTAAGFRAVVVRVTEPSA